jgi:hypothetical protein
MIECLAELFGGMVPPESFSISAAQAMNEGLSGWAGGTQEDIFKVTVLSCAKAGAASKVSIATAAARRLDMHVSPGWPFDQAIPASFLDWSGWAGYGWGNGEFHC